MGKNFGFSISRRVNTLKDSFVLSRYKDILSIKLKYSFQEYAKNLNEDHKKTLTDLRTFSHKYHISPNLEKYKYF